MADTRGYISELLAKSVRQVTEIRLFDDGVEVTYRERATGRTGTERADFCISNIPVPILAGIPAGFSPDFQAAVDHVRFAPTSKVGWQAEERFWGTLTGAYNFTRAATELGRMSLAERLRTARQGAIRLHEEFAEDRIVPERLGLSIAWQNVPFQKGGWAEWSDTPEDRAAYARLLAPDGRFHVVGDQVSTLPGWQEGAMMSAEHVVEQIAGLQPLTVPEIDQAPETRRLVEGLF